MPPRQLPARLRSRLRPSSCIAWLAAALCWTASLHAAVYPLPPLDTDLIGQLHFVTAEHHDTLLDIARRLDVGQDEIELANPGIDRWLPGEGTQIIAPTRFILPAAPRTGIVLNIPEMRLYYYPAVTDETAATVQTFPVSVGRMDWATPVGTSRITAKTRDPSWTPPESIRIEAAERGEPLPAVIPPGPDNPLGKYAMRLSLPGYLIHSTNKPYGVGMRVTHGCLRMYPEDIEMLFPDVPVGTPVEIVKQPVKLGWFMDTLYAEIHPPLEEETDGPPLLEMALNRIAEVWEKRPFVLDGSALKQAVEERSGMPVPIARAKER
ncbi:MAG: L,D-transpeptidase family protein [Thiogranum sp.]|nr:L,D-transpeptidase family protein [Thiogranum sp.]